MSVIIKDMEKPKFCFEQIDKKYGYEYCPFVKGNGDCILLLEKGISEWTWEDQYKKCPLVEVPEPHGRLIDGDALIAAYDAQHEGEPGRARKLMEEAPTIIEAEGEE